MSKVEKFERPEGFEEHHRRKGDRQREVRGAETLLVGPLAHKWIEEHPAEARRLGWSVSRTVDPLDVPVVIPETLFVAERKPRRKPEKGRPRATLQIRVPADQKENGSALWDEMIEIGREFLCPILGWEDDVPAYNVAMVLMARGLEVTREEVEEK